MSLIRTGTKSASLNCCRHGFSVSSERQAAQELTEFMAKWGGRYQAIGKLWKDNWERVIPFFEFPPEVRRVIYTTNAVESLHIWFFPLVNPFLLVH